VNDIEHRRLREALGVHVLGQLTPDEATEVETHLDTCESCRVELAELRPVAAALSDLRESQQPSAARPPAVPPDLGDRVLAAVTADQRRSVRSRWTRTGAVAGIAAASAAIVTALGLRLAAPEPDPEIPLEAVSVTEVSPRVQASADLVAHTWGVEVKLRATGFESGRRYVVRVLAKGGNSYPAGEFIGTGGKEMNCNLNSSVLRDRARGFEVRNRSGDVVLASRF
jgi:anti-sigma factor RsiW